MLQPAGFVWRRIVKLLDQVILRRKYKFVLDTDHVRELITGGKRAAAGGGHTLAEIAALHFLRRAREAVGAPGGELAGEKEGSK